MHTCRHKPVRYAESELRTPSGSMTVLTAYATAARANSSISGPGYLPVLVNRVDLASEVRQGHCAGTSTAPAGPSNRTTRGTCPGAPVEAPDGRTVTAFGSNATWSSRARVRKLRRVTGFRDAHLIDAAQSAVEREEEEPFVRAEDGRVHADRHPGAAGLREVDRRTAAPAAADHLGALGLRPKTLSIVEIYRQEPGEHCPLRWGQLPFHMCSVPPERRCAERDSPRDKPPRLVGRPAGGSASLAGRSCAASPGRS